MDINQLIAIIKKKLLNQIEIDNIQIEDKSFLHKNNPGNQQNKFHLKISLKSKELKKIGYPITNKEYKNEKLKSFLKKELTN